MNAQAKEITAATAQAVVRTMKLTDLYLSELNPRQTTTDEDTQLMADSLATIGLIHPVAGLLDKAGKVGVVAGGRRLRGLSLAVKQRPELADVPVMVTTDKELALEWAATENMARKELDTADAIRAYGQMASKGKTAAQIASCFGRTEKHVYKLLKLVDLPSPVLDALKDKKISFEIAKIMTTATDEAKVNEGLALAIKDSWNAHQARCFFNQGAIRGTDSRARYVGAKAFKDAGGEIVEDLFNEQQQWYGEEILDKLFEEKLAHDAEELRKAQGWSWADISWCNYLYRSNLSNDHGYELVHRVRGSLTDEESARYEQLGELSNDESATDAEVLELEALQAKLDGDYTEAQKSVSGIVVYADSEGVVQAVDGLIRKEDQKAAIEAGILEKPTKTPSAPKSDYSLAFIDDMKAVSRGALQAKLVENPRLALDLVAFSLSDMASYERPIGVSLNQPVTSPSIDDNYSIPDAIIPHSATTEELDYTTPLEDRFAAFMKLDQKERDLVLVKRFSRSLDVSFQNDLFETLAKQTGAHQRQVWTPSETNCFKRLKAELLDECFAQVLDIKKSTSQYKDFAKLKKKEKAAELHKLFNDAKHQKALKLTKKQLENIKSWVPNC